MEQFNVSGMSCAACSARVEKAVSKINGVSSCTVNLLTNSMNVDGSASTKEIIKAVKKAGYSATLKSNKNDLKDKSDNAVQNTEMHKMKVRLIASICILIPLMYISMGHVMWGFPLPDALSQNHIAIGIIQLLMTTAIAIINQKFFISGFKGIIHLAPNMDTLVALGSTASYIYSLYALFAMTFAQLNGDMDSAMHYMHEFYFESAAMILTLITLGKTLEAHSKGKTTDAIKSLMKLSPKTAVIKSDSGETEIPIENVKIGDIFIIRPGDNIPVDGIIINGTSAVNESALTGESIPVDKTVGDTVSAATLNQSGYLECEATRVGEDTTLSQIIKMVSDSAATKAPIAKIADKVSGIFVPTVITISIITFIAWLIYGEAVGYSLARAVSVLVISCPCALGLATPVAIMVGNGKAAKCGIMFKTAESLEQTGKIEIVALDKTGTVTKGDPEVTDIIPYNKFDKTLLMKYAAAIESKSEHPLAKSIIQKANNMNIAYDNVDNFESLTGSGLKGQLGNESICCGNQSFISTITNIENETIQTANMLSQEGKTPLFFCVDKKLIGLIAVADVLKPESFEAIRQLHNMNIRTVMLTGDNERTAQKIAEQAGVDEVIANVKPDEKEAVIRNLKSEGKVCMVGDGINDAPALTSADIGIAIGRGTDIAVDAAEVVLIKSELTDVPASIRMSKATLRNIHENLFWAFFYNVVGIPIAAGILIPIFGLALNPMFAAAAMSLSSICVVLNALRLNTFKIYNISKDKKSKTT